MENNKTVKLNIIIEPEDYEVLKAIKNVNGASFGWQLTKAKDRYIREAKKELLDNHGYKLNADGIIEKPEIKNPFK